jgi:hypothetical protein
MVLKNGFYSPYLELLECIRRGREMRPFTCHHMI